MTHSSVQYEQSGPVVTLRLNRPEVRNAVNVEMVDALTRFVERLAADESVRVVIVCGAGRGFSAGADLAQLSRAKPSEAGQLVVRCAETMNRLASLPLPVIAAVHGFALGGGFLLSMYCDLRLVASGTKLGLPSTARVWMLPWAMSRLASLVGVAKARQFVLTGGVLDADRAKSWGLVDVVVPQRDLERRANELAADLATWPRHVMVEIRNFFCELEGLDHAYWDSLATAGFVRCFSTQEAQTAMARFRRGDRAATSLPNPTGESPS